MTRAAPRIATALLAAGALGLAAAAMERDAATDHPMPARAGLAESSLVEILVLLRWGYGALDWLNPETTGDRNDRGPKRAG